MVFRPVWLRHQHAEKTLVIQNGGQSYYEDNASNGVWRIKAIQSSISFALGIADCLPGLLRMGWRTSKLTITPISTKSNAQESFKGSITSNWFYELINWGTWSASTPSCGLTADVVSSVSLSQPPRQQTRQMTELRTKSSDYRRGKSHPPAPWYFYSITSPTYHFPSSSHPSPPFQPLNKEQQPNWQLNGFQRP